MHHDSCAVKSVNDEEYWVSKVASQLEKTNTLLQVLVRISLDQQKLSMTGKVSLLADSGFTASQIAEIVGTSAKSVHVLLSRIRKKK